MPAEGKYALLCLEKGNIYCSDYTNDEMIAKAWESENSMQGMRWYEDTEDEQGELNA